MSSQLLPPSGNGDDGSGGDDGDNGDGDGDKEEVEDDDDHQSSVLSGTTTCEDCTNSTNTSSLGMDLLLLRPRSFRCRDLLLRSFSLAWADMSWNRLPCVENFWNRCR